MRILLQILLCLTVSQALSQAAPPPNVLFIMTDQQFADAMSFRMGTNYLHTPAMDRLAAEGTVFTRAYSSNPLCMPFRNSVMTGRYPHQTGITINDAKRRLNPAEFVSLGTYLQQAGYETAYAGKWHLCYNVRNPAEHGFQSVSGGRDADVANAAAAFFAARHDRPFLFVASFLNPHNICEWARRLAGRDQKLSEGEIGEPPALETLPPPPANLEPPRNEPDSMTLIRRAYQTDSGMFPVGKFTVEDWRKQRWGYYRMIEKVDAEIGKVMEALRRAGLETNTVVIFTSDHGECAGAHRFNQKTVLYEESARVPLIISWKGKTKGTATDKLVNTGIDLLPTMLDFAGTPAPSKLPGRSLTSLALGKPTADWRDYIVVQNNLSQTGVVDGFQPTMEGRMLRTARFKYCVYSYGDQRESLVDLEHDPGEMVNLATDPKYRQALLEHRRLLERYAQEQKDPLVARLLANDVGPVPFPR